MIRKKRSGGFSGRKEKDIGECLKDITDRRLE
jgi:hypothetical protein